MKVGFVIGTPRSGKSRLIEIMLSSGKFAWISYHQDYFPKLKIISFYNRIYDIPIVGRKLFLKSENSRFLPYPMETNRFWRKILSEFEGTIKQDKVQPHNKSNSNIKGKWNISEDEIKIAKDEIENIFKWQGKEHMLLDYSKWPMMNYFSKVFPGVKFVHIIRDGKVVALEYERMIRSGKYTEWSDKEYWIESWPKEWRQDFLKNYQHSILAFCAYQWKYQLKLIWEDSKNISKERYMEVRYEDLTENPEGTISNILNYYGLEFNENIEMYLKQKKLINMNNKIKKRLSKSESKILDRIIYEKEYTELIDR